MTSARLALTLTAAITAAGLSGCAARLLPSAHASLPSPATAAVTDTSLQTDIDRLFDDPIFARALVAARVETLRDGRVLYAKNAGMRMVPASSLKIVTAAAAATRLGWHHRFETRLDAIGSVVDGVLHGDLVVVGTGDPTIAAGASTPAATFAEWADVLRKSGVTRVEGRLIGDDNAFDDEPIGAGWAWDYLTAGYAAPSGALSYNNNVVVVRLPPGDAAGDPVRVDVTPEGHGLSISNAVVTVSPGTNASLTLDRPAGSSVLTIRGHVPAGGPPELRTATVVNPTFFFVEALRVALADRGIVVRDGAWDIDDVDALDVSPRRTLAVRHSPPLSVIVGQMMKNSQNFYAEMLIKALGRSADGSSGSTTRGRQAIEQTLNAWGLSGDSLVMYDGSGLSRYNYATADLLVGVLRHVWHDETLRGPFVASLPVGGHDGTLGSRMSGALKRRAQAKTGTIANVRSLAGFAETAEGEKLVFAIIANHFTAPNAEVDAVMEKVLERVAR